MGSRPPSAAAAATALPPPLHITPFSPPLRRRPTLATTTTNQTTKHQTPPQTGPDGQLKATGVRLADGRVFRGKAVISNATRWDTFEGMIGEQRMPQSEKLFRRATQISPKPSPKTQQKPTKTT